MNQSEHLKKRDNLTPSGKWSFSEDVASCFEDMLPRSVPGYETMRRLVSAIGTAFVTEGGSILDIGCSNGMGILPFVNAFGVHANFILSDTSEPMLDICREKYACYVKCRHMEITNANIMNKNLAPKNSQDLVLAILVLMFIPVERRPAVLRRIYESLRPGGAFLMVEKVTGASEETDGAFSDQYYHIKLENGYTQEQIDAKRISLENVLTPLKTEWNQDLIRNAGFHSADIFWKCLNFCGWLAVK